MKSIITVKELSKTFETKNKKEKNSYFTAVDNISFEVEPGEVIGFIGPNGAGKSTTIKMMTGILFPTEGDVSVCGYSPWEQRHDMTYHIGTMFGQKSSLLSHLPVIESYKLLGAIYDIDKKVLNERVDEVSKFFEIEELLHKKVSTLSLGQRMICEVAAVTLHRPDVILFDEPTIGLDIVVKKKVRKMIRTLNEKYGTTIFITSHDISDIERLCSRVILINHGKIMLDSSMEEIRHGFLNKKKITVTFDEHVEQEEVLKAFEGKEVLVDVGEKITVEYDETVISTGKVVEKLMRIGSAKDLNITNTSLENIIYDIYTSKKEDA